MGIVMIVCPITGQRVPTGIVMDAAQFERAILDPSVVRCSACGRIHTWSKKDAELSDDPPAPGQ